MISPHEDRFLIIFGCVETAFLVFLYTIRGFCVSLISITIVDFEERLHTDLETLGVVMTISLIGRMAGGFCSGIIQDRLQWQSEFLVATCCIFVSLTSFVQPFSPTTTILACVTLVSAFFISCIGNVAHTMALVMWRDKASVPVHAFHFGHGFGSFFGTLFAEQYLSIHSSGNRDIGDISTNLRRHNLTHAASYIYNNDTDALLVRQSRIEIPFAFAGGLMLLCFCIFVAFSAVRILYIKSRGDFCPSAEAPEISHQTRQFLIKFVIMYLLLLSCWLGMESLFVTYLFAFAYDLGFAKEEAAFLSSAFWACFAGSRLVFCFLAHFISVKILLHFQVFATAGSLAGLAFIGLQSTTGFWVFVCLVGVMISSICPSAIAFADRYIPVRGTIIGFSDITLGLMGALNTWLGGRFIERGQFQLYLYVCLSYGCLTCILSIAMHVYGTKHGDRYSSNRESK